MLSTSRIDGLLALLPVVRFIVSRSSHNLYAATPSVQCTRSVPYRKELKLNLFITRIRSQPSILLLLRGLLPLPLRLQVAVFQLQQLLLLRHLYGSERGNTRRGESR